MNTLDTNILDLTLKALSEIPFNERSISQIRAISALRQSKDHNRITVRDDYNSKLLFNDSLNIKNITILSLEDVKNGINTSDGIYCVVKNIPDGDQVKQLKTDILRIINAENMGSVQLQVNENTIYNIGVLSPKDIDLIINNSYNFIQRKPGYIGLFGQNISIKVDNDLRVSKIWIEKLIYRVLRYLEYLKVRGFSYPEIVYYLNEYRLFSDIRDNFEFHYLEEDKLYFRLYQSSEIRIFYPPVNQYCKYIENLLVN